jgi:hypothetical protein
VKRVLAAALLACGLAATAVPAAQAVPVCGTLVGVDCTNGSAVCRVWIGPLHRCIRPA